MSYEKSARSMSPEASSGHTQRRGIGACFYASDKRSRFGKAIGYVQTFYGMEEVLTSVSGRVLAVMSKHGEKVEKGEIIAFIAEE